MTCRCGRMFLVAILTLPLTGSAHFLPPADPPAGESAKPFGGTKPCCRVPSTAFLLAGGQPPPPPPPTEQEEEPKPRPTPALPKDQGKLVRFHPKAEIYMQARPGKSRRVWFKAKVCLRRGPLEVFVTRDGTKEHESILTTDIDARLLHSVLVATGAKPGSPATFVPDYKPARGQKVAVSVYFTNAAGKPEFVDGRKWVRNEKTRKAMAVNWVFAGSRLTPSVVNPKKMYYRANGGEVISVANFQDAMLDLPIKSLGDDDHLLYQAWTERVPPLDSEVYVVMEPLKK